MSLSKASKAPLLFTQKFSGTDDFVKTTSTARQWKLKDVLVERSLLAAIDIHVYLYDTVTTKKYLLAEVLAATTASIRISPTLNTGEYFVDSDAEIRVESASVGVAETWTMRVTGSLVA